MKSSSSLSAKSSIPKKLSYKQLTYISLTSLIIFTIISFIFISNQSQDLILLKQQVSSSTSQTQSEASLEQFISTNQNGIEFINQALPGENQIVNFVEAVEILLSSFSSNSDFNFSSLVPSKQNNQAFIPFNIKLSTSFPKLFDFMRQFEKMPYLTEIISVSIKTPTGLNGSIELTLGGRIYVQDPF